MRKPDFDAFNTTGKDVKELKSSMEDMPLIQKPPKFSDKYTSVNSTPVPPVRGVLPVQSVRRKIKSRHPFDIYEDQNDTLNYLSVEDRKNGGKGSMSAMVREALDDYFEKKRQEGVL